MVTPDSPLYERDPSAWRDYLAEGNAKQARKRVSADVIIRDADGKILLVNPSYKPDWDVPGGMVEANEPPHVAARRELKEELGIDLHLGPLLVVDWVSPHDPWDDLLSMVFDRDSLTNEQISKISSGTRKSLIIGSATKFRPPNGLGRTCGDAPQQP